MEKNTDFVKLYCDIILKKIVAKIASDEKKKEKAVATAMKTAESGSQVRTMRHWRSVANNEFYYREIDKGFRQLSELDTLTNWSDSLHQDRYRFVKEKYADILDEYLERKQ